MSASDKNEPRPSRNPRRPSAPGNGRSGPNGRNGRGARNGSTPPKVTSGLARKRRNPALTLLGDFGGGILRFLTKDLLTTGLLLASIGLVITFFLLLGSLSPGRTGAEFPLSRVLVLAGEHQIADATLLDHDSRVVVDTFNGQRFYANYPSSGAATQSLVADLTNAGARVSIDPQSGKPQRQLLAQFLIPIVLLVCLFAFFTRISQDGGAGGIAGFSAFAGKGRRRGKGTAGRITFEDVAGAGEAVAELREICDYLDNPGKYTAARRRRARRGCCSWDRRGPARRCWPGPSPARRAQLLLAVGLGVRRVAGRRGRGPRARPVSSGPRGRAGHHLHRRARRRRAPARRRHGPGQRRARADAQPDARRDGRLRRPSRPSSSWPPPTGPTSSTARCCGPGRFDRQVASTFPTCTAAPRSSSCMPAGGSWSPGHAASMRSPSRRRGSPAPSSRTSSMRRRC